MTTELHGTLSAAQGRSIDAALLLALAPKFTTDVARHALQKRIVEGMAPDLVDTLARYEINTVDRVAHFLAQACVESGGFSQLVEQGDDAYFSSKYDGRMGNTVAGEGIKFKGRGLLQITGRSNYDQIGTRLELDLINDPDGILQPYIYLLVSCEFWRMNNINRVFDAQESDDARVEAITHIINGGISQLKDRRDAYVKVKPLLEKALSPDGPPVTPVTPPLPSPIVDPTPAPPAQKPTPDHPSQSSFPDLEHGAEGPAVKALETLLVEHGMLMTGTFTVATQTAVKQFQLAHGLDGDGVVGPETWLKLMQAR